VLPLARADLELAGESELARTEERMPEISGLAAATGSSLLLRPNVGTRSIVPVPSICTARRADFGAQST
jgi:hypothetical protein